MKNWYQFFTRCEICEMGNLRFNKAHIVYLGVKFWLGIHYSQSVITLYNTWYEKNEKKWENRSLTLFNNLEIWNFKDKRTMSLPYIKNIDIPTCNVRADEKVSILINCWWVFGSWSYYGYFFYHIEGSLYSGVWFVSKT